VRFYKKDQEPDKPDSSINIRRNCKGSDQRDRSPRAKEAETDPSSLRSSEAKRRGKEGRRRRGADWGGGAVREAAASWAEDRE